MVKTSPVTKVAVPSKATAAKVSPILKWILVLQTVILVALVCTFIYLSFFHHS